MELDWKPNPSELSAILLSTALKPVWHQLHWASLRGLVHVQIGPCRSRVGPRNSKQADADPGSRTGV